MKYLIKVSSTLLLLMYGIALSAQPFIDPVSITWIKSTRNIEYKNLSTTLPIEFKNKRTIVVMSPYIEDWKLNGSPALSNKNFGGFGLPLTWIQQPKNSTWQWSVTAIYRKNDLHNYFGKNQIGGAILINKQVNPKLTYKFGLYYNKEYFGNFIMPLIGIDWQIDNRTSLFGVLPGNLVIEHKSTNKLYLGSSFKAVTTSFAMNKEKYLRIDDNRLSVFADLYLKSKFVLTVDAGHSVFRSIKIGSMAGEDEKLDFTDNPYLKVQLSYRIRFKRD